jgi:hypothetical protein
MKRASCLIVTLALSTCALAQTAAPDERGAYLSATFGNGRIGGPDTGPYRLMRWRAAELRVGSDLNPALVGEDSLRNASAGARIDVVYVNEGHPDNNHRDGFALQLVYAHRFGRRLFAEAGAGPYTSMNTTTIGGVQYDAAHRGMLYSAALRFPLRLFDAGTELRVGVNHVSMRDAFHSDALLVGVGRHITDVPPFPETELARGRLWLGAYYGKALTNMPGSQATHSGTFEAKQYSGKWAMSFTAVFEGDDGVHVDRRGVAAQFWFVQPLTERWAASAGFGPYIAENRRENNRAGVHGLITLQFERKLGERTTAFFAFHRVKTYTQMNDRDLFHLGLQHVFAGG